MCDVKSITFAETPLFTAGTFKPTSHKKNGKQIYECSDCANGQVSRFEWSDNQWVFIPLQYMDAGSYTITITDAKDTPCDSSGQWK